MSHWSSGAGGAVCCCISLQPHCRMVWLKPHVVCCSRGADMCRMKGMRYAQGEWKGPRAARILCCYFLFNNGHHSIVSELPITYYTCIYGYPVRSTLTARSCVLLHQPQVFLWLTPQQLLQCLTLDMTDWVCTCLSISEITFFNEYSKN